MVALAIPSVGLFCVFAGSYFCWILWIAPAKFKSRQFQKRWKFLLIKFQPGVWWWAPVLLLKAILLNLAAVCFADGQRQLGWIFFVAICYQFSVSKINPWRSSTVSSIDFLNNAVVLGLVFVCTRLVRESLWSTGKIQDWISVVCVLPACAFALAFMRLFAKMIRPRRVPLEEAQHALKMVKLSSDVKAMTRLLAGLTKQDRSILAETLRMLTVECDLGQEPLELRTTVHRFFSSSRLKSMASDGQGKLGAPSEPAPEPNAPQPMKVGCQTPS